MNISSLRAEAAAGRAGGGGGGDGRFAMETLPKAETMKREVTLLKALAGSWAAGDGGGSRRVSQAERKEREATLRDKEMEIGAHKLKAGAREALPRRRPRRALFRCRR